MKTILKFSLIPLLLHTLTSQAALTVTNIARGCDAKHSLFLQSDGSLWAMGFNGYGQLGDGTLNNTNRPEQIVAGGTTAIAAGVDYSFFLKSDGSLWAMGFNGDGELGDGYLSQSPLPEQIFPAPQPVLLNRLSSKTNLQFSANCGFGGNFRLLGSTNLALPLSQWTPIWTNSVTARGTNNFSVTMTNAVNAGGRRFYILQSQ